MEAWREAAALLAVFVLLGAAVWALRHRAGGLRMGSARSLSAVERIALTPQHALHLVRAAGRELLVVTHPHGCSLLFEQIPGAPRPPEATPFSETASSPRPREIT
jgi:flagellar biogenesis protein FliO